MPAKPNSRNWSDVQTALATMAVVGTLGLWNLFATPSKSSEPVPVIPPTEVPQESVPVAMPQVKIMFTPAAPQTTVVPQVQTNNQQAQNKKKKNKNKGDSGPVTQTKTS